MGKNKKRFCSILIALMVDEARSAKHVVGGSQGWDASTDFSSWTSSKTFNVGDQLVFKYSSMLHSVVELPNESAYKNCDMGTVLDSKNTGNDVVKLNKSGTRYFTCGTSGHCDQGMKVKIKIGAHSTPSSPSTTYTSPASNPHSFALIFVLTVSFLATLLISFV